MKIRHCALLLLAALLASCGTDSTQSPNADPPVLSAQLDGRYAQSIRIEGGQFTATDPGQEIVLTFAAQGMVNVKQFELRLEIEPANALAFEGSSFICDRPLSHPALQH